MRISVECGGFTEAADACRTANQVAALVTGTLAGRLVGVPAYLVFLVRPAPGAQPQG